MWGVGLYVYVCRCDCVCLCGGVRMRVGCVRVVCKCVWVGI